MPPSRSVGELAGREVAALQVVEPRALAELLVEADQSFHRAASSRFSHTSARAALHHVLDVDAEPAQHLVAGRADAEAVDADRVVGVALPAERRGRLDGQHRHARRQHRLAVLAVLGGEAVPARQADDAHGGRRPSASCSAASMATATSLPVATMTSAGSPSASRTTPAPRSTAEPSVHTGTPWRVSTSTVGPSWSTAARHAAAVSLASAGRITCRPGIARSVARCSTGWWVGPSSPTPTESWLKTNTTLAREIDARRTGGRM